MKLSKAIEYVKLHCIIDLQRLQTKQYYIIPEHIRMNVEHARKVTGGTIYEGQLIIE